MDHAVIDTDVHNVLPRVEALFPYLSDHWREYIGQSAFKGPVDTAYPPGAPTTVAPAWRPAEGEPAAGSTLELVRRQLLDPLHVEIGILNCAYALDSVHNPDAAAALASAVNDWQVAEWLEPEPRLRASILVPNHYPEMAAKEIDRVGEYAGFVQVVLPARAAAPYGNRRYHPIFAAAARHDLVVGIQFGGAPGSPSTGAGWPSFYIEEYVGMAHVFQTQILSMVVEGVFDRFPELRVSLIESGWTWLPSLMWRIDKDWKGLRREVPWNTDVPSAYIKRHMRLTTQPVDPPPDTRHLLRIIDQLGSDELLMFSSDYPHWRVDAPAELFPDSVPVSQELRRKILRDNARQWYRL